MEAFRVAIVAGKGEHFADDAAAWLTFNMDNKIDSFSDLCLCVCLGRLRMVTHNEIGKTMQGLFCGVRMDGCQ